MKLALQLMSDCETILVGFSVLHASSTLTAWRLNILQLFHRKISDSLVGLGFQAHRRLNSKPARVSLDSGNALSARELRTRSECRRPIPKVSWLRCREEHRFERVRQGVSLPGPGTLQPP